MAGFSHHRYVRVLECRIGQSYRSLMSSPISSYVNMPAIWWSPLGVRVACRQDAMIGLLAIIRDHFQKMKKQNKLTNKQTNDLKHVFVIRIQFHFYRNYTSIDPKQQQRMFPPRSCAIQNSWNCLAHCCLLFYSITSTIQIRGNKRDAPTHPGIHTEWRSLIFRRVQNWYKLFFSWEQ